jgi:hypothetical protein
MKRRLLCKIQGVRFEVFSDVLLDHLDMRYRTLNAPTSFFVAQLRDQYIVCWRPQHTIFDLPS